MLIAPVPHLSTFSAIESEIKSGQAFDPVTHMRFRAMSLVAGF
jgi:hypothetical protein